ncbi:ECF transporter S component [Microbacterium invictum]|uniref:ECF transporter S component n=1 Tax=Microbacterium invictum TaxID=515415 RepID=A0ABZ0VAT8_9MICO|nr:ECF transporter S component [Microbacterium invictum]WQB70589.1 ECF transporter S component [Microbacterium invictum]
MARPAPLTTRVLLTCAAIGVATGVLQAGAGALSGVIVAAWPILYGLVLGIHVLPGVIAQELLRQPWVALLTHVIAALVASAVVPVWIGRYIGTAILIGLLQEGVAALTSYRRWEPWRFFVSAVVVGVVIGAAIWFAADVTQFRQWQQVVYVALFVIGPIAWTAVGLGIGRALRRAGVRPPVAPLPAPAPAPKAQPPSSEG